MTFKWIDKFTEYPMYELRKTSRNKDTFKSQQLPLHRKFNQSSSTTTHMYFSINKKESELDSDDVWVSMKIDRKVFRDFSLYTNEQQS